jgi:protein arginine kinase
MTELGWLKEPAPYRDVVLSQRVRLARNLLHLPFPHVATEAQLEAIAKQLRAALEPLGLGAGGAIELSRLDIDQRARLAGARLISPALLPALPHRWVLLNADGSVSALLNEEDHLRLQITHAGWQPERMVNELRQWEEWLNALPVRWGYSSRLGYLTASPINLGSGVRLGLLMHLMGLQRARQITRWLEALQTLGCHTRGLYGEGSLAFEGYVQISLLGRRDPLPELMARLHGTLRTLIEAELEARQRLPREELDAEWEELSTTLRHSTALSLGTTLRLLAVYRMRAMRAGDEARRDLADRLLFGLAIYAPPEPPYAAVERARFLIPQLAHGA